MSSINRLGSPTATASTALTQVQDLQSANAAANKRKVNLFDVSQLTTPTTVQLTGGSAITLPAMSTDQASKVQSLFAGLSAPQQTQVNDASDQLGQALFSAMQNSQSKPASLATSDDSDDDSSAGASQVVLPASVSRLELGSSAHGLAAVTSSTAASAAATGSPYTSVSQGTPAAVGSTTTAVGSATTNAMSTYNAVKGNQPYDNQVLATTYMGVSGLQSQMTTYAEGMQQRQNTQSTVAADGNELRQASADWPQGTHVDANGNTVITMTYHTQASDGTIQSVTKDLDKAGLDAAATNCDNITSSMSDQTQLDQIKLQSMSQNYSNALNMMSNLMKASYDTVKNTLGNIHY